jgi:hypothetical protein
MANENGTHSIRISLIAYNALKKHTDDRLYTLGGFADKAILTAIENELKKEKRRKSRTVKTDKK